MQKRRGFISAKPPLSEADGVVRFASALWGFLGGGVSSVVVSLVHGKLKGLSEAVDLELERLDDLTDKALALCKLSQSGATSMADAMTVTERRHRLGRNLHRLLRNYPDYDQVKNCVAILGKSLATIEPDSDGKARGDADAVDTASQAVRAAVRKCARGNLYWRFFRKH